jgi:hypothetical protein
MLSCLRLRRAFFSKGEQGPAIRTLTRLNLYAGILDADRSKERKPGSSAFAGWKV